LANRKSPIPGVEDLEATMTAIARLWSRAFSANPEDESSLVTVAIFCGLGLLASLCMISYGLDLSAGFF
jgi:hypothetical protein